jgi:UDP-3-O-[3-hydroxymyristoyl] glucosamine N-acyltransferase
MIDNLVQIGHNVVVDDIVTIGGQGGSAGHLTLGKGPRVAAHSGVFRDIAPGETVCGFPALPSKEFWRGVSLLQRLARKKGR